MNQPIKRNLQWISQSKQTCNESANQKKPAMNQPLSSFLHPTPPFSFNTALKKNERYRIGGQNVDLRCTITRPMEIHQYWTVPRQTQRATTPSFAKKLRLQYSQLELTTPGRTGPSRWRSNYWSHDNLRQDLADRRMANPLDPVLGHHTQARQPAAVPDLPNDQPHQPPKQSHAEDRTE